MKNKWKNILRGPVCGCLAAAGVCTALFTTSLQGLAASYDTGRLMMQTISADAAARQDENTAETAGENGKEMVTDGCDENTAKTAGENGKEMVAEENPERERIEYLSAEAGKYTGADILEIRNHHCNVTDTKINWLKKSYINTSNGSTNDILASGARCLKFRKEFTEIGAYAFAGADNANRTSQKTMQDRMNKNLYEITFGKDSEMCLVGEYAFSNLDSFKAFDGEQAVMLTELGEGAFYNDRNLASIILPPGVTTVYPDTFTTNNPYTRVITKEGSVTDQTLQGSQVLRLPGRTYYTYEGLDAAQYSVKTFPLTLSGIGFQAKIQMNGKEIMSTSEIPCGADIAITLTPQEGYEFTEMPQTDLDNVSCGYSCEQTAQGYQITFIMTQAADISVPAALQQFPLSIEVEDGFEHGQITIEASDIAEILEESVWSGSYSYGTEAVLSVLPNAHYHVEHLIIDGKEQEPAASIVLTMKKAHDIKVSFVPDRYELIVNADETRGCVKGNETIYAYGTTACLSIQPEEGYEIAEIMVNGMATEAAAELEIPMETNTVVQVTFKKKVFFIQCIGEHVAFSNDASGDFSYGKDIVYTFQPQEGYEITGLLIDGKAIRPSGTYTFHALCENHRIEVTAERICYSITVDADKGALVTNNAENVFFYDSEPEFYFKAEDGYRLTDIRLDGVSIGVRESYKFAGLRKDHTLSVRTERVYQVLLIYDEERGTAETNQKAYRDGESAELKFCPREGYYVSSIRIDERDNMVEIEENSYVYLNVHADTVIYVIFTTSGKSEVEDRDHILDEILDGKDTGRTTSDKKNNGGGNGEKPGSEGGENGGEKPGSEGGENGGEKPGSEGGENGGEKPGNESSENGGEKPGSESGESGADKPEHPGESVSDNKPDAGDGNGSSSEKPDTDSDKTNDHDNASGESGWKDFQPDKTRQERDEDGNVVDKSARIIRIDFNPGGGEIRHNYFIFYEGSHFKLPTPVRYGYEFAGWYMGNEKIESTKQIHGSIDWIVARWTPAVYRITYDLKGGVFKNASRVPYLYSISRSVSLVKPVREGYIFAGWYLKETDIKVKKLKKNLYYGGTLELEAKWYLRKASSYTLTNKDAKTGGKITYDVNGGYFNDRSKVKDYYAFMTNTPLPRPVRTGYQFEGWYIEGTEVRLTKISRNQYLEDVRLTARWSRSHYTVTYCANKGRGKQDKTTLVYDRSGILKSCTFSRKGYVFTGWNTRPNGSGIPYQALDEVKNLTTKTNLKLYAQWQKLY